MKKISGAVVGLGYWGPNLVRNFIKISGVEIAKVFDTSPTAIKKFRKQYPTIHVTENYLDLLCDNEISFIAIATPISTHFSLAKEALLANKHVLIEKPLTQTSNQARELVYLAKERKKILMVGHTFIYTDAVRKIKKIISQDSFGELLYFDSTRINLGRLQKDANVIWDLAPHDLSILSYLFPDFPNVIQAMGSSHISKRNIEIAHIFLTYKKNFTAHIHVSWLSPVKIRNIIVAGKKQMILFNDIEPSEKIRIYDKSVNVSSLHETPFSPIYRTGKVVIPHIAQHEGLQIQLEHFISCMRNNERPITDGEQGLKVVQLLETIDRVVNSK